MKVAVSYYAILREQRGLSEEVLDTLAVTPLGLYLELQAVHGFTLDARWLRAAVNDEFVAMDAALKDGDRLTYIPPVAGG